MSSDNPQVQKWVVGVVVYDSITASDTRNVLKAMGYLTIEPYRDDDAEEG